jgi:hypothetical protein
MTAVSVQSAEKNAQAAGKSLDELAAAIYVELIGRAFLRVDNVAVIKPEAGALATLSYELAVAFKKAEKMSQAAAGPQNVGYDVQLGDMAGWKK